MLTERGHSKVIERGHSKVMMLLENTSRSNIEARSKQALELVVSKKRVRNQKLKRQKQVEVVERQDFQRQDHGIFERSLAI